ncbi:MAG: EAL domain-containing protein [Candidatus Thiodiazotropha sp. (ex Dulcina madagascariensis)]|nr:EAL domain-containing protein [Candidatus Thiodiazotropha sp. (ex Dulcina madagascariensis)]
MTRKQAWLTALATQFHRLPGLWLGKIDPDDSLARQILSAITDGILVTDTNLRIVEVNEAFTRVTGYTRHEAIGQTPRLLKSGRHGKEFYQRMWNTLLLTGRWQGTIWNRRKSGEIYQEWMCISSFKDKTGQTTHFLAIFTDLSHQKALQNQIHLLAYYDSLTGLPNRELFNDRLDLALTQAHRDKSKIAIFFLDLDRFKTINDTLGHATGDLLLSAVAHRLSNCLRESDTVARLGGDEFAVILSGIHDQTQATTVADKILTCFKQPYTIGKRDLFIGTSLGISLFPDHGSDNETLVRHADTAMYRAKQRGMNCHVIYTPSMDIQYEQRLAIENDLRDTISENGLKLVYQPQIDLKTGRITTLETLLRWTHPQKGNIPPSHFIPIAEESGLIFEIGNWIFDTACTQIVAWREKYGLDICVAINITSRQLRNGKLVERIQEALHKARLPPAALELEITESVLMDDSRETIKTLENIKRLGIKIVIDDFGIGFSSLNHIKRFSIDKLKIDKSFIDDLNYGDGDKQLVKTIINMTHDLSLVATAEGIEKQDQLHELEMFGCDMAQGFLICAPRPASDMDDLLLNNTPWHKHFDAGDSLGTDSSLTMD